MAELKISFGLDKLIEAVSQGLSALAKPWMLRRVARARADSAKILAGAEVELAEQLQLPAISSAHTGNPTDASILQAPTQPGALLADDAEIFETRIEQRVLLRERRRQQNLESIVLSAAQEMPDIGEVSEDAIDDDWVARFFMDAQDVSDSKLQQLWAKILAQEVAKPRTTSLRTLEVLRNLSAAEAHLFQECLRCVCESDDLLFFIAAAGTAPWTHRHLMSDCGLFGLEANSAIRPDERRVCRHGDIRIAMSPLRKEMDMPWHVTLIYLSEAGKALARICWRTPDPDKSLLEGLVESYASYFNIEVEYLDRILSLRDFLQGAMNRS